MNRSLDGSANPRWKMTRLLGKNCFWIKRNATGYHSGSKLPSRAEWSQLFRLFLTQSLSQHRFSLKLWLQRLAPQLLSSLFARREFWITVWVEYDSHLMWVNVSCSCSKSSLESLSLSVTHDVRERELEWGKEYKRDKKWARDWKEE